MVLEAGTTYPDSLLPGDEAEEFHKVRTYITEYGSRERDDTGCPAFEIRMQYSVFSG